MLVNNDCSFGISEQGIFDVYMGEKKGDLYNEESAKVSQNDSTLKCKASGNDC